MVSLSAETWRLVVDQHTVELAEALTVDLGPVRARTVTLSTAPGVLRAAIDSGDDPTTTAWETAVRTSWLWAPDGIIGPAPVALETTIGARTWTTSPDGMRAVDTGCDRGHWAPTITSGHLRAV